MHPGPSDNLYAIGDGDPAVTLEACTESSTQLNGGFVVAGPRCASLDVYINGRREPEPLVVSFGAGKCAVP